MPAHDQGVASFNCAVGANQAGPSKAAQDTVLNYLGANLTAGAGAAATLTIMDANAGTVIATLAAVQGTSESDLVPTFIAVDTGTIFYTLTGVGATAQIRTNTG